MLRRVPDRSRKRPRDLNRLAKSLVDDSTSEAPREEPAEPAKDPAAVELGRRGGLKGGKARAEKMCLRRPLSSRGVTLFNSSRTPGAKRL